MTLSVVVEAAAGDKAGGCTIGSGLDWIAAEAGATGGEMGIAGIAGIAGIDIG